MFWADRVVQELEQSRDIRGKKLVIRDEKTMSGRVHVGSMRAFATHGLVSEVLKERGIDNEYFYEFNDFDPFDKIPGNIDAERFAEHLGKPLYAVPSPEPGFANYAEYFAAEYQGVHERAGFTPTYYRAYGDLYKTGRMDALIRTALDRTSDIRRILKEVSGSVKDETWLPVSVVCEKCGKMTTVRPYDWDGETVAYACEKTPPGTEPCGNAARIAPFGGNAKFFWKVDWAAKWIALGVDIEGGGKDHSTKGGARDVANHIAREVFNTEPPFDIPHEFFLIGGKKMASSKGRGASAKEMSDLFPPAVFRLLLIGKDINQQIDIDPEGESVPRLYDWYDELAEKVREGIADDFTRLYVLCQLPENQADASAPWQLRFSQVAFMVQMPHLVLADEAAKVKGSALTDDEVALLEERAHYARIWLASYAPESYRYELQATMPPVELADTQKEALRQLHAYLEENERTGEEIQNRLFELKDEVDIKPAALFSAIYQIFLARTSGPKAGWFLSVLPRDLLLTRLREASK